ncbi:MAG: hypothetical protein FJZ47_22530 [Candidatus Tectomicrobia bacterium]|uniref:CoA transferase n=1 Tax=Tectimicrobiota bacterium TaxID=2528274 RepID=A0A937W6B8_UNCTE|nr:hypothetical protein [Candidatus Tectomicrobia bacterium]
MQLPLEDVKILDLSHALAGPFCSTMLGDFGAQVVKIEVPGAGDISRGWGPPFYQTETAWLTDKSRPLYFSSRFLVLKHKSRLPTFGILLL